MLGEQVTRLGNIKSPNYDGDYEDIAIIKNLKDKFKQDFNINNTLKIAFETLILILSATGPLIILDHFQISFKYL
jgi:uncharacterized membrane protein YesL